jgi:hypothetical protein
MKVVITTEAIPYCCIIMIVTMNFQKHSKAIRVKLEGQGSAYLMWLKKLITRYQPTDLYRQTEVFPQHLVNYLWTARVRVCI